MLLLQTVASAYCTVNPWGPVSSRKSLRGDSGGLLLSALVGIVCKPLSPQLATWKIKLLLILQYVSISAHRQWYCEHWSCYIIRFSFWQLKVRDCESKPTAVCKDRKPFCQQQRAWAECGSTFPPAQHLPVFLPICHRAWSVGVCKALVAIWYSPLMHQTPVFAGPTMPSYKFQITF